jgi:hypothetical protein
VNNLRVESVSGPTCYPGENGFSSLIAYVKSEDAEIINRLRRAAEEDAVVVVRCAALEVSGKVGKIRSREDIPINVDDLRLFKRPVI